MYNSFIPSLVIPPRQSEAHELDAQELEALIEEARRRARRRHIGYAAVILGALAVAGGLVLVLGGDHGESPPPSPGPSWHLEATQVPASRELDGDAYMGVSCPRPNSIACDRVGLSVTLKRRARQVDAAIAGEPLELNDPEWSGDAKDGQRTVFAGFLKPAGLFGGPLDVGAERRSARWIGREPVSAPVRLWILRDGASTTTAFELELSAGWG